jgi:hypothetical protein
MNRMIDVARFALAATLLATGLFKLVRSREALLATGHMNWVMSVPTRQVRAIATLELLAVIGLVVPPAVDTATFLVPLAAAGAVALMIGAAVTHARLGEQEKLPLNAAIALVAVVVGAGA